MTIYPVSLRVPTEQQFADEPDDGLTAAAKQQILSAWRQFISNGFKQPFLTEALHTYLFDHCSLTGRYSLPRFWQQLFDGDVARLKAVINQFGGDRRHAFDHDHHWLAGPTADLKAALCDEMTPLYGPLMQVLSDLEQQHEAIIQVWHDFAQGAVSVQALPPTYQVSANTRNLLTFAAHIARKRPLPGLQTMMMFTSQPDEAVQGAAR